MPTLIGENAFSPIKNKFVVLNYSRPINNRIIHEIKMANNNVQYEHGYALFIGITYNHLASNIKPLKGTFRDVEDLNAHFTNLQKAAYKTENVILLTEEKATRQGILTALETLAAKAEESPEASVIVYYSGHGIPEGLVPYDFDFYKYWQKDNRYLDSMIESKIFSKKIAAIKAPKQLIILDCCHAENIPVKKNLTEQPFFLNTIVEELETELNKERTIFERGFTDDLQKGQGRIILTSCQANETSLDLGSNGLFTQVLLECLNGTNNIEKDGWVRLIDLIRYVPKTVADRAEQKYKHNQHPMFKRIENLNSQDFILCAYDITTAKGLTNNSLPRHERIVNKLKYEELKEKINMGDFFDVIEFLHDEFEEKQLPQSKKGKFSTLKENKPDANASTQVINRYKEDFNSFLLDIKKHLA